MIKAELICCISIFDKTIVSFFFRFQPTTPESRSRGIVAYSARSLKRGSRRLAVLKLFLINASLSVTRPSRVVCERGCVKCDSGGLMIAAHFGVVVVVRLQGEMMPAFSTSPSFLALHQNQIIAVRNDFMGASAPLLLAAFVEQERFRTNHRSRHQPASVQSSPSKLIWSKPGLKKTAVPVQPR